MNQVILSFEKHVELGPVLAAKLLGYPYSTYAQYKNGSRELRPYVRRHIQAVMLLQADTLKDLIAEVLYSGDY
jgi:hypothetical protein